MSFEATPVSIIILLGTVLISLYAIYGNVSFYEKFLLSPYLVVQEKKWFLMFSSGFLHADLMHLLFNMLTFYFFAFTLEWQIGPTDFLIIYLGSMFLGNISTIIKQKDNPYYKAVGASGAVSGVIFASVLYYPDFNIYLYFAIGIPAPIFAILYLAYCHFASKYANDNINHEAHFWGAASGVCLAVLLNPGVVNDFISYLFD